MSRYPVDLPKPVSTTIDLTEACPFACDYCFTWLSKRKIKPKKTMLDLELGKKIIDWWIPQTDESQNINISWWGGEPLLEWDLLKKLTLYAETVAKDYGRNIVFGGTTNGWLYTPDKVEWLLEHRALMLVSLDGIKIVHDKHRKLKDGSGTFDRIYKNLKDALKIAPFQRVRSSITADSVPYMFESFKMIYEDLGIDNFAFSPVFESEWTDEVFEKLKEQFELILDYAVKKALEGKPFIMKHINDEALISNVQNFSPQNPCGAGRGYMGFDIYGFIHPCHRFNKHGLTYEERSKLPTIIGRPIDFPPYFEWCNFEWRKKLYKWKDNPPIQCKSCEIYGKSSCNGGCYAVNWDLTGSLYSQPEAECRFNKIQHEIGLKYAKMMSEKGLKILRTGWGGNLDNVATMNTGAERSCLCYNMCFMQGTFEEIQNINRRDGKSCLCYQFNYQGPLDPPNTITLRDMDKLRKVLADRFELCARVLMDESPKDKERKMLEGKLFKQTSDFLRQKLLPKIF